MAAMPDDVPPPIAAPAPGSVPLGTAPPVEEELWRGHTSQWVHFWYYFFCVLLIGGAIAGMPFTGGLSAAALVIPVAMWTIRWWVTRSTLYVLSTQRLKIHKGILNRQLEEIELYRVKDYVLEQPLFLRMLGLGNVTLVSSDVTTPRVALRAIPDVATVREQIRSAVQSERDRKRVRELDVDNTTPSA
jgi:uncharacterized membrane protein YdbT with pleckstrin-like domain